MTRPKTLSGMHIAGPGPLTLLDNLYFTDTTNVSLADYQTAGGTSEPAASDINFFRYNVRDDSATDYFGQTSQILNLQTEDKRRNGDVMGIYLAVLATDNPFATNASAMGTGMYLDVHNRGVGVSAGGSSWVGAYHVDLFHEGVTYTYAHPVPAGQSPVGYWSYAYQATPVGYGTTVGYNMEVKRMNTRGSVLGFTALNDPFNSRFGGDGDVGFKCDGRPWTASEASYALAHSTYTQSDALSHDGVNIAGPQGSFRTQFLANAQGSERGFDCEYDAILGQFFGMTNGNNTPAKILSIYAPLSGRSMTRSHGDPPLAQTTTTDTVAVASLITATQNGDSTWGAAQNFTLGNDGFTYVPQLRTAGAFAPGTVLMSAYDYGSFANTGSPKHTLLSVYDGVGAHQWGSGGNMTTYPDPRTVFHGNVAVGGLTGANDRADLFVYGNVWAVDRSGNLHLVYSNP